MSSMAESNGKKRALVVIDRDAIGPGGGRGNIEIKDEEEDDTPL